MTMTDNDFSKTAIFASIKNKKDPYTNSLFKPLKDLSSRSKGAAMEKVCEFIVSSHGFSVSSKSIINDGTPQSDYDRVFEGKKVEIKGSFSWGNGEPHFRWQQIRVDQGYDYVFFLAFFPDRVDVYYASKVDVKLNLDVQDKNGNWTYNQHGGKKKRSGTFSIDGVPSDFLWMKKFDKNVVL